MIATADIKKYITDNARWTARKNLLYWRLSPDFAFVSSYMRHDLEAFLNFHIMQVDTWVNGKATFGATQKNMLVQKIIDNYAGWFTIGQWVALFAEWEHNAIKLTAPELLHTFSRYYYDICRDVEKYDKLEQQKQHQQQQLMTPSEYASQLIARGATDESALMFVNLFCNPNTNPTRKSGMQSIGAIMKGY